MPPRLAAIVGVVHPHGPKVPDLTARMDLGPIKVDRAATARVTVLLNVQRIHPDRADLAGRSTTVLGPPGSKGKAGDPTDPATDPVPARTVGKATARLGRPALGFIARMGRGMAIVPALGRTARRRLRVGGDPGLRPARNSLAVG